MNELTHTSTNSLEDHLRYTAPELIRFGSIRTLTGHCSSGCDHDSIIHPDEYKEDACEETLA